MRAAWAGLLMGLVLAPPVFAQGTDALPFPETKAFFNSEKLKLLEGDAPITADQIYPNDPTAKLKQAFDCGGVENLNTYISELYGRQELHYAAVHGDALRVKQLLLEKVDINPIDTLGRTPLMLAALNGRLDVVKILLEAGADPTIRDVAKFSAYDYTVTEGWPEIEAILKPLQKK